MTIYIRIYLLYSGQIKGVPRVGSRDSNPPFVFSNFANAGSKNVCLANWVFKCQWKRCSILSLLLCLVPKLLVSQEHDKLKDALHFYADDLPSPQVAEVELLRWRRKWMQHESSLPDNAVIALAGCDDGFYPNTHKLLQIPCTLPITSAECERSLSTLRRLKTYLRATLSSERESSLALMNTHHGQGIDVDAVIDIVAQKHQRCPFLADLLSTDWEMRTESSKRNKQTKIRKKQNVPVDMPRKFSS